MYSYQSDSLSNLIPALLKAQLKLGVAEKSRKTGGSKDGAKSYSYKYADWPTLVEVSRKPLADNGLCVSQRLINEEDGGISLSTLLMHISGEFLDSRIRLLITPNSDTQKIGSCITYFKRYAYAALIGIVTTEGDDDGQKSSDAQKEYYNSKKHNPFSQQQPGEREGKLTQREVALLEKEFKDHPKIVEKILEFYKITSLKEMPPEAFLASIEKIRDIKQIESKN